MKTKEHNKSIDSYIRSFPVNVQRTLRNIRAVVRGVAPGAEETIKYQIPTFVLHGKNLVHFAAWKTHIGFYPTPTPIAQFSQALEKFTVSKGAIQFPLDKALPVGLIKKLVKYRMREVVAQSRKDL